MSTKTAPAPSAPAANTDPARAVEEAQRLVDDLEIERTVLIPKREYEIRFEVVEARDRGDQAALDRLREEKFSLARRNNDIIRAKAPAALNALGAARQAHLTERMDLPTGTVEDLEEALEAAHGTLRLLQQEQGDLERRIRAALQSGDSKAGPALLARRAALPFELAAAEVRMNRTRAGLAQARVSEIEAELPALTETAQATEKALAEAREAHSRAVGAMRARQDARRDAASVLIQLRKDFAEQYPAAS